MRKTMKGWVLLAALCAFALLIGAAAVFAGWVARGTGRGTASIGEASVLSFGQDTAYFGGAEKLAPIGGAELDEARDAGLFLKRTVILTSSTPERFLLKVEAGSVPEGLVISAGGRTLPLLDGQILYRSEAAELRRELVVTVYVREDAPLASMGASAEFALTLEFVGEER